MDLPKVFDCIPYKHLIAKLQAYRHSSDMVTFLVLKNKTENAKTYNTCNMFEILLSDVSEGSILDTILFSILITCFLRLMKSDIHNFSNDNATSVISRELQKLVES